MSKAEWVWLANSLFDSFGDVVVDAVYNVVSRGQYNQSTGGYHQIKNSIDTKFVFTKMNRRLVPDMSTYEKTDRYGMVRGSDFSEVLLNPGDEITVNDTLYKIREVLPDEADTGAYYELRLSVK